MLYEFDRFYVDVGVRELRRENVMIEIEPQVFDLLVYLIEHRDCGAYAKLLGDEGTFGDTAAESRREADVHRRFSRWSKSGVWARVFRHLADDADNEYAMIDSTIVRAHQHSAGAQKKPARTRPSDDREAG